MNHAPREALDRGRRDATLPLVKVRAARSLLRGLLLSPVLASFLACSPGTETGGTPASNPVPVTGGPPAASPDGVPPASTSEAARPEPPPATSSQGPPICEAVEKGVETTRALLEGGADPSALCLEMTTDANDFGLTMGFERVPVLARAARRGEVDIIQLLLDSGASIDAADDEGRTALMAAARAGRAAAVQALLAGGAQPDARDKQGLTALMQVEDEPVLSAFLLNEAGRPADAARALDTENASRDGIAIVRALVAAGADPDATDNKGQTALMHARADKRDHLVRALSAPEPAFDAARMTELQNRVNRAGVGEFYAIASGPSWPIVEASLRGECDRMILWNGAAALVYGGDPLTVPDRFPGVCVLELAANAGNLFDGMLKTAGFQGGHDARVLYEFWPRRLVSGETDTVFLMYDGRIGTVEVRTVGRRTPGTR